MRRLGIPTVNDRVVQIALKDRIQDKAIVLYNPASMRIVRYRFRETQIATP
jgi:hypothetical protein